MRHMLAGQGNPLVLVALWLVQLSVAIGAPSGSCQARAWQRLDSTSEWPEAALRELQRNQLMQPEPELQQQTVTSLLR